MFDFYKEEQPMLFYTVEEYQKNGRIKFWLGTATGAVLMFMALSILGAFIE